MKIYSPDSIYYNNIKSCIQRLQIGLGSGRAETFEDQNWTRNFWIEPSFLEVLTWSELGSFGFCPSLFGLIQNKKCVNDMSTQMSHKLFFGLFRFFFQYRTTYKFGLPRAFQALYNGYPSSVRRFFFRARFGPSPFFKNVRSGFGPELFRSEPGFWSPKSQALTKNINKFEWWDLYLISTYINWIILNLMESGFNKQ